jgi:predicted metal-dependent phosphotriesterase family hydrolase
MVQTVTGPLSIDDLGLTLVHEHLIVDMYEPSLNALGVLLDERAATEELALFGEAGGGTVVDQTTVGLNPDFEALRRISEASGVRIVAGTGIYWRRFRPAWVEPMTEGELADLFIGDLTEGRGPSRIRAGIIGEIATGHRDIDDVEARVLRAAAAAQNATGVPIATHALFTRIGLDQLDVLEAAGANPGGILVGHADTCPDERYHEAILERGAWLGFDTVGQLDKTTDDWRADRIAALAELGHLGRILISSDVCKRPALSRNGGGGYAHVIRDFVPRLSARGFGDAEIRQLLVENPRRLFEAVAQPA